MKYRIEVSKALDLFTFISVHFGFILRKIKVVVVVVDDDNLVQSPGGGGGWGERRRPDFRFNPAIKYTLKTLTRLNFFL